MAYFRRYTTPHPYGQTLRADELAAWSGPPMQRQPDGRIEPTLHDGRALTL